MYFSGIPRLYSHVIFKEFHTSSLALCDFGCENSKLYFWPCLSTTEPNTLFLLESAITYLIIPKYCNIQKRLVYLPYFLLVSCNNYSILVNINFMLEWKGIFRYTNHSVSFQPPPLPPISVNDKLPVDHAFLTLNFIQRIKITISSKSRYQHNRKSVATRFNKNTKADFK